MDPPGRLPAPGVDDGRQLEVIAEEDDLAALQVLQSS
jgi:hypothetical protein